MKVSNLLDNESKQTKNIARESISPMGAVMVMQYSEMKRVQKYQFIQRQWRLVARNHISMKKDLYEGIQLEESN